MEDTSSDIGRVLGKQHLSHITMRTDRAIIAPVRMTDHPIQEIIDQKTRKRDHTVLGHTCTILPSFVQYYHQSPAITSNFQQMPIQLLMLLPVYDVYHGHV